MTIAAGFRCIEGIILCADSQETITGYTKQDKYKIYPHSGKEAVVHFVGAGTSDYIEAAVEHASIDLSRDCSSPAAVSLRLKEKLNDFFVETLSPWSVYPENERPTVELLIGVVCVPSGPSGLYHWRGTAFHEVGQYAIGAGVLVANSLFGDANRFTYSLDELANSAAYILYRVKQQVDTCGGKTNIVILPNDGSAVVVVTDAIDELERKFAELDREHIKILEDKIKSLPSTGQRARFVMSDAGQQ